MDSNDNPTSKDTSTLLNNSSASRNSGNSRYGSTNDNLNMAATESTAQMIQLEETNNKSNLMNGKPSPEKKMEDKEEDGGCRGCCQGCVNYVKDYVTSSFVGCKQGCVEFCGEIRTCCQSIRDYDCAGCCKSTFSLQTLKNRLPILKWGPKYRWVHFFNIFLCCIVLWFIAIVITYTIHWAVLD